MPCKRLLDLIDAGILPGGMQARQRHAAGGAAEDAQQLREFRLGGGGKACHRVVEPLQMALQRCRPGGGVSRKHAVEHGLRDRRDDTSRHRRREPAIAKAGTHQREPTASHREHGRSAEAEFQQGSSLHASGSSCNGIRSGAGPGVSHHSLALH